MRHRVSTGMDADLLQADVMRFMAIIAFCLIAILALVRQIEPAPLPASLTEPEPVAAESFALVQENRPRIVASAALPAPQAAARPEAQAAASQEPVSEPAAAVQPELPLSMPALVPIVSSEAPQTVAPVSVSAPRADAPAEVESRARLAEAPRAEARQPATAAVSAQQDDPEPGLILRFVTDQDFLRLVAKGDIQVFLFGADSAYQLRPDYRFVAATTPRELFEVLPDTVPALIRSRAAGLENRAELRYGLQFPPRIERQLSSYLAQVDSGALLIDRYGRVSHVSTER